ncbi:sushi, von Willebrand factor type A, EGF and pentraxin domain-containing protein 1-like isoform X1 [Dreissena polymorpha]|uniref:sushi, von Willebrand factor type A, EGF and pentraxin domain-containing protein 1-like isoform X1 n=1 Tax=Dreissena polymorpha TaxID=45954 RepID=UPI002265138E|nr:sushi, von Willebrand factor type A, EGF and pentraxin domain-containing protein 1-like isoform X1 [Dreissena polymorpha]
MALSYADVRRDGGLGISRTEDGYIDFNRTRPTGLTQTHVGASKRKNPFGWGALGPTVYQPRGGLNPGQRSTKLGQTYKEDDLGMTRMSDFRSTMPPPDYGAGQWDDIRDTQEAGRPEMYPLEQFTEQAVNSSAAEQRKSAKRKSRRSMKADVGATRASGKYANTGYGVSNNYYQQGVLSATGTPYSFDQSVVPEGADRQSRGHNRSHDSEDVASRQTGDFHVPGWRTLATTPTFMDQFYEQFRQLKTKWSPYDPSTQRQNWSEQSSTTGSVSTTSSEIERRLCRRWQCIAVLIGFSLLAIGAVIIPIIVLVTADKEDIREQVNMRVRSTSENFISKLANNTSEEFRNLSNSFCAGVETNCKKSGAADFQGCLVTSIENGSIIINFTIVIKRSSDFSDTQLKEYIGIQNEKSGNIGPFVIAEVNVTLRKKLEKNANPIPAKLAFNNPCSANDLCLSRLAMCIDNKCACESHNFYDKVNDACLSKLGFNNTCSANDMCLTRLSLCINNKCTCESHNIYDKATDTCAIIDCGKLAHTTYSNVTANSSKYGDIGTKRCHEGYEFPDGNTTWNVTCRTNGTWGKLPECSPVNCSMFNFPTNANNKPIDASRTRYQDTITLTCKSGYKINGQSTATCQSNKTWSQYGTCEPIKCKELGPISNSKNNTNKLENVSFGENIPIDCLPSYVLIGGKSAQCNETGDWPALSCRAVNCNGSTDVDNGFIMEANTSTLNFKCNEGHQSTDNMVVTCFNGTWEKRPNCIKVDCGNKTDVVNGKIVSKTGTLFGDTQAIECNTGYMIEGERNITCQSNGTWSRASCQILNCGNITVPDDASVLRPNNGTVYGSVNEFECREGYALKGNSTVKCQSNGDWEDLPRCERKNCGEIKPRNWTVQYTNDTKYQSMAYITCDEGFSLVGKRNITCLEAGWEELPSCFNASCKDLQPPDHMRVTDYKTVECEEDYTLFGKNTIQCLANGTWEILAECIKCDPVNITNGTFVVVTPTFANVSCSEGFELQGNNTATCRKDGWVINATCKPVKCQEFPSLNNSITDSKGPHVYPEVVTLTCESGFELAGSKQAKCLVNGSWLITSSCNPVRCPNNTSVNDSSTSGSGPFIYKTIVQIACNLGFIMKGNQTAECLANGTWNVNASCERVLCPNTLPIGNSSFNDQFEYAYQDVVNITCNEGFNMTGNSTAECRSNGTWGVSGICERTQCLNTTTVNNSSITYQETYYYQDVVNITCHEGFNMKGNSEAKCRSNGTWGVNGTCERIQCLNTTTVNDSSITYQESYYYQDVVNITCHEGFNMSGDTTAKCLRDGTWNVSGQCDRIKCSTTTLNNSSISNQGTHYYQDVVNVTCNIGFQMKGDGTAQCLSDGMWNVSGTCERIQCSNTTTVNYSSITYREIYYYQDVVNITCYEGYTLTGDSQAKCHSNGTWKVNGTCERIQCLKTTSVNNSSIKSQSPFYYLDIVNVTCDEGFNMTGNSNAECLIDGTWNVSGFCEPVTCPLFTIPDNASIANHNQSRTEYVFQETLTLTCASGYAMNGRNISFCQSNGTWSRLPSCEEENTCNETLKPNVENVTCDTGFQINKSKQIQCLGNGSWDTGPLCDPVRCPNTTFVNDSSIPGTGPFTYTTKVDIVCDLGFNMTGNKTAECLANGTWNVNASCERVLCPNTSPISNSSINDQLKYAYQDVVTITCNEGFNMTGNSTAECRSNGTWGVSGICERIKCLNTTTVNNSSITYQETYYYQDVVNITCHEGFNMSGDTTAKCLKDGTWNVSGKCDRVQCSNTTLNNSSISNQVTHYYQDVVNITCNIGFQMKGDGTAQCLSNGMWNLSGTCERIQCSNTTTMNYSSITNSDKYYYQDVVNITCNEGYNITGDSQAKCHSDGTWKVNGTCERIQCLKTATVNNSSMKSQSPFYYLDVVNITCDEGFIMTGNASAECLIDGTWNVSGFCEPVNCPLFTIPDNASIENLNPSRTKYDFKETLTLICATGFLINGSNTTACQSDGSWTILPSCVVMVNCIENVTSDGALYTVQPGNNIQGTIRNVTCLPGLTFRSSSDRSFVCNASGQWQGNPQCQVPGSVSFARHQTEIYQSADVVCTVSEYTNWQKVMLQRQTSGNATELFFSISSNPQSVVNNTSDGMSVNATSTNDSVVLSIHFDNVTCDDVGLYACVAVVPAIGVPLIQQGDKTVIDSNKGVPILTIDGVSIDNSLNNHNTTVNPSSGNNLTCVVETGLSTSALILEVQLQNDTMFRDMALVNGAITRDGEQCFLNITAAYDNVDFTADYNMSTLRCSLYMRIGTESMLLKSSINTTLFLN